MASPFSYNIHEQRHEKTNNVVSEQVIHKTELYKHRRRIEAANFRFKKKRNRTIPVAKKTKALISCAVTAHQICALVFAYADCWFSTVAAHIKFLLQHVYIFFVNFLLYNYHMGA